MLKINGISPLKRLHDGLTIKCVAIVMILFSVSSVFGQNRSNFTGRWELDSQNSQLRPGTKWNHLVLVIEHQDPKLTVNVTTMYPEGGESTLVLPLATDGRDIPVDQGKGRRVYRSNWVGPKLVVKWDQGGERTETWSLSRGGKILTIDCSAQHPGKPTETWKHVLVKK